jgi:serine/threonine protein kinase
MSGCPSLYYYSPLPICLQEEIIRETQLMRLQAHPNVLPLYCAFVDGQKLWMVMPYVSGGSVLNIMKYRYPQVWPPLETWL